MKQLTELKALMTQLEVEELNNPTMVNKAKDTYLLSAFKFITDFAPNAKEQAESLTNPNNPLHTIMPDKDKCLFINDMIMFCAMNMLMLNHTLDTAMAGLPPKKYATNAMGWLLDALIKDPNPQAFAISIIQKVQSEPKNMYMSASVGKEYLIMMEKIAVHLGHANNTPHLSRQDLN
jgi:hypothetical protein